MAKVVEGSDLKPMERLLVPGHCNDYLALGVCSNAKCTCKHAQANPTEEQKATFIKRMTPVVKKLTDNRTRKRKADE